MLKSKFWAAALLAVTLCGSSPSAIAQSPPQSFDSTLTRLADVEATLLLETQLSELLTKNDKQGLRKLAASLKKEGDFDSLLNVVKAGDQRAKDLALRMNACHYAGLWVRVIALRTADGSAKAVRQKGFLLIQPNTFESGFVENMSRCEKVYRHPISERKIGTTCPIDGRNCL